MAILTKSVIGCSPLLIAFAYLVITREYKRILDPFFIGGHLLAACISGPWFAYQYFNHRIHFVEGHIKWLLFKSAVEHENAIDPAWYVKQLLAVYWPWLPFALYAFIMAIINNVKRIDSRTLILLCWTIAIVGVMSCMKVRKIHYIMTAFPPLALFSAAALSSFLRRERIRHCFTVCFLALLGCVLLVVMTTPVKLPPQLREDNYFENLVDETHAMTSFARNHLEEHEKIVLYRIWLWRIRSTYLFYADRDISAAVEDTDALITTVRAGKARYCLADREHAAELSSLDSVRTEIQAETPSLILFKMTEVPPSV
jgi:4-amino-4-deoxy-L-arabinose transferase-like glycosyltransferase